MKNKIYTLSTKGFLFGTILLLNSMATFGQAAPDWIWANRSGGTDFEYGSSITVDANGNSYITGHFRSSPLIFGSNSLVNVNNFNNSGDIFIVKYDVLGNVIWAKSAGGPDNDYPLCITVDALGNLYITGFFGIPSITFGTITLTNAGAGEFDIFITKYDTSGNVLWAKSAGGTERDEGNSVTADANGNSYITGYFNSDSITFGSITLINADTNIYRSDLFIVKYDASGNVLWANRAGGNSLDEGRSITVDANGNSYITGYFDSDSITFGSTTLIRAGGFAIADMFVVKYDVSGNAIWAESAGGIQNDVSEDIVLDSNGNLYITGYFNSDSITFGSAVLINTAPGYADIFTVKYDNSGAVVWAKSEGGPVYDDIGSSLALDANGNIYVTGLFGSSSITIGSTILTNAGSFPSNDIFIVKYDNSGNVLWAISIGGNDEDGFSKIATDTNENVYLAGGFGSTAIAFGTVTLTNAGYVDIFIAKLDSAVTTGISEQNNSFNAINIFPNPGNGQVKITSSDIMNEIKITNPLGQIIYMVKPNEKNLSLQINNGGIYFMTITSGKQITTRKLVVQR